MKAPHAAPTGALALVVAGFVAAGLVIATPAYAPPMVALELAEQRALGYRPCEPVVSQLPASAGLFADAATPGDPGVQCEIRIAAHTPAEALAWVAWHEVCHQSTMQPIHRDPAHQHPMFLACLDHGPSERGGY